MSADASGLPHRTEDGSPNQETGRQRDWSEQMLAGNMDGFWLVWHHYYDALMRRCLTWMGNIADAEDAMSIAALRCHEKLPKAAIRIKNIEAYLFTITHNVCMDLHRAYRRKFTLEREAQPASILTAMERLETEELHGNLTKGIQTLPEQLRMIIELRLKERSYKEISAELGISLQSAYKRHQRARTELRALLLEQCPSGDCDHPKNIPRSPLPKDGIPIVVNVSHTPYINRESSLPACPSCGSTDAVRNGIREEKQRYRCRRCQHQYLKQSQANADLQTQKRRFCKVLVQQGKAIKAIARELGVSPKTVRRWTREQN